MSEQHPVFDRCDLVIDNYAEGFPERLMETESPSPGDSLALDTEAEVTYEGIYKRKGLAEIESVLLVIDLGRDIALSVFSAWLYEKLTDTGTTISTPRGSITVDGDMDESELQQVLEVLLDESPETGEAPSQRTEQQQQEGDDAQ